MIITLNFANGHKAYYRKLGLCFDFVTSKDIASELTKKEADKIMNGAGYYLKMYGAERMTIE